MMKNELVWEYTLPLKKDRNASWALRFMIVFVLAVCIGALLFLTGGTGVSKAVLIGWGILALTLLLTGAVCLLIVFLVMRGRTTCRYAADDRAIRMAGGRYGKVTYGEVKRLTPCRAENRIGISGIMLHVSVYAGDEDYEAVWAFISERCPQARIDEERA